MPLRINKSIIGSMRLFRNPLFAIACLILFIFPQISNAQDWRCEAANRTAFEETDINAFYNTPRYAGTLPGGTVLRYYKVNLAAEYNSEMPSGHVVYRVLYVTTSRLVVDETEMYDMPVVASGLLTFPEVTPGIDEYIKTGKQTLLINHGTVGINPDCGPSRDFAGMYIAPWMHDTNLKTAAPDYYGLGYPHYAMFRNPDTRNYTFTSDVGACGAGTKPFENSIHHYLGSQSEARSSIDLVRAARNLEQIIVNPCQTLTNLNDEFAVVGISQGGHAALAVGELMDAGYANDLTLKSIVAAAPPSVLRIEEDNTNLPMILAGYAQEFWFFTPSQYMSPEGMCDYYQYIDTKCIGNANYGMPKTTGYNPFNRSYTQLANDLYNIDPYFPLAVDSNTPGQRPINYHIMVGQNTNDPIVPHLDTDDLVDDLESQGANVTYCKTSQNAYWWQWPYGKHNNHNFTLYQMFYQNTTDQDTGLLCDTAKDFLATHGLDMDETD